MNLEEETARLRTAILAQYRSVYAFWKENAKKISKSVVVQVMAGKYPGNNERQIARMWGILVEAPKVALPALENLSAVLETVCCRHCTRKRKKRNCKQCRVLWHEQSTAILKLLEQDKGHE